MDPAARTGHDPIRSGSRRARDKSKIARGAQEQFAWKPSHSANQDPVRTLAMALVAQLTPHSSSFCQCASAAAAAAACQSLFVLHMCTALGLACNT